MMEPDGLDRGTVMLVQCHDGTEDVTRLIGLS